MSDQPANAPTSEPAPSAETRVISTQENPEAHIMRHEVPPEEAGANAPEPPAEPRPEWLPEEFKSAEEFSKWYADVKADASEEPTADADGEADAAGESDDDTTTEQPQDQYADPTMAIVAKAGLDYDTLQSEFFEKGVLSDEAYTKLGEVLPGVTPDMINKFLNSAKSEWAAYGQDVREHIGGDATFKEASAWANDNFTPAQTDSYNRAVLSGDIEQAKLAVEGMVARYRTARGTTPRLVEGDGSGASVAGFESRAQVVAAMTDKRYREDPAYRDGVTRRLAQTPAHVI